AFAALRQVPPAHVLEFSQGIERRTRYWRPWDTLAPGSRSETPRHRHGLETFTEVETSAAMAGDAGAATLAALTRAVESRVPGEVPFGVFLSGGVDSSLVASLAARVLGHAFPTFSLRLDHRGYDESGFARAVSQSIGAEHHELTM